MSARPARSGEGHGSAGALAGLIAATLAARLLLGGLTHLSEDEAYYRLWSFAPAFGYFDHPPMIAWWIWLGRHIAADTPLGVRLLPSLSCAVSTALVFDAATLAGAEAVTAFRAAVLFNATLLIGVGGFLAVPDSPASLFWLGALWASLKARRSPPWWIAAGAMAGLAVLSKYSALFLAPGLGLWLLASAEGRATLARPWPWLGAGLGLALFSANVAWNADHDWLTFAKQFGRVARGSLSPDHLPEFLLGQALLANPLIAVLAMRGLARGGGAMDLSVFALSSAPFALFLVIHSLHAQVEAHWPAPIYAALAIIAATGAQGATGGWRAIVRLAPWLGIGVTLIAFGWLLVPPAALAPPFDPALPIRGWTPFARSVEAVRARSGAAWVGTVSYGLAAQLADEPSLTAPIAEIKERARYLGLRLARADVTRPGLVVDLTRRMDLAALGRCFASVRSEGILRRGDPGGPTKAYLAARVFGPRVDILRAGCPS